MRCAQVVAGALSGALFWGLLSRRRVLRRRPPAGSLRLRPLCRYRRHPRAALGFRHVDLDHAQGTFFIVNDELPPIRLHRVGVPFSRTHPQNEFSVF